jgi:coenzyme PQQ precursor peptide PqqA
VQHKANGIKTGLKKISLANFWFRITLSAWAESVRLKKFKKERAKMAWKTPKIVEVPVGMEINMYACAARK